MITKASYWISSIYLGICTLVCFYWPAVIPETHYQMKGDDFFFTLETSFVLLLIYLILFAAVHRKAYKTLTNIATSIIAILFLGFIIAVLLSVIFAFLFSGADTDVISFFFFIAGFTGIVIQLAVFRIVVNKKQSTPN